MRVLSETMWIARSRFYTTQMLPTELARRYLYLQLRRPPVPLSLLRKLLAVYLGRARIIRKMFPLLSGITNTRDMGKIAFHRAQYRLNLERRARTEVILTHPRFLFYTCS